MEKTVDNPTPDFGTKVTFTIKVTNNGPSNADVVEVTDLLPAGLDFVSATTTQGTYNDATGLWGVGTVMTSTATLATLTIDALVNTLDPVTNTATITNSSIGDPDHSNNTDDATVTPVASDLAITKSLANFFGDSDGAASLKHGSAIRIKSWRAPLIPGKDRAAPSQSPTHRKTQGTTEQRVRLLQSPNCRHECRSTSG